MPPTTAMPRRKARFESACASGSVSLASTFGTTNEQTIRKCVATTTFAGQTKTRPAPMITSERPA